MRKGYNLLALLIAVFGVIFVPSIEVGPRVPIASATAGLHGAAQVGSWDGGVAMSGLGAGTHMLQFKAGGHLLGFQPRKVYFASLDHALSVEFLGTPGVMPKTAAGGRERGNKSNVPSLGRVVYEELWEGISLTYEAREGGIAESTYHVGSWADVSKIRLRYNVPVEVQGDGSFRFKFDRGYLTESPPEAWQEIGGERVPVKVAFRVTTGGEVGFSVGPYDPSYPLTIRPTYSWHTFYGEIGTGVEDYGSRIATDGSGYVYVTGLSNATWNGPAGQNPLHAHSGATDIFVLKLNSSGAYQWHTFYGSSSGDYGYGIAIASSGNVYITGYSYATWNGPAGEGPFHAHSGGSDIFVLKLNSSGTYQWHTFYGSSYGDYCNAIAIDGSGNVYVTGGSYATWNGPAGQSPLHGFSGATLGGDTDIFVLKLNSSGTYQWHTFYGSSNYIDGYAIATDGSGYVYVTGRSNSTWNGAAGQSPLHAHSGSADIFVLKLNSSGAYQWHTFYGSSGGELGYGIATDGSGNVYVTGRSNATWNGPTGGPPLHAYSGGDDVFALKLNSSGTYQWHTFYGSSSVDYGHGIRADARGNVYITGESNATWNGPAGQNPLHAYSGNYDIFVLKLNSSGFYQWHTFYGSSGAGETGSGIATDGSGNVYVTGWSYATWNGPAGQNPLHAYSGGYNIFVLKLSDAPSSCDFNGDGKTDIAVYRSGTGAWYVSPSGGGAPYGIFWGGDATDKPAPGDYDGDGKTDIAVYRTGTGAWYVRPSGGGAPYGFSWGGNATDKPVPGDYDGDGKTDIAVYRTGTGAWYVSPSGGGAPYGIFWGGDATDKPAPGDYDGDGKTDIAVYRTGTGAWYVRPSGGGAPYGFSWGGNATDKPVPGDYDGDGKTDIAVYRTGTGAWYVSPSGGGAAYGTGWGGDAMDKPTSGDYDGDGKTDCAVYRTSTGAWYVRPSGGGTPYGMGWGGNATDKPVTMNLSSIE